MLSNADFELEKNKTQNIMTEATPSASTTLIFVPGAWHTPACYSAVIGRLNSTSNNNNPPATFNVVLVSLSSVSCSRTSLSMTSWQPDIDAVLQTLQHEVLSTANENERKSNVKNVLVVSHSYGSLVANEALGTLISSHPQMGSRINLRHLILCGFVLNAGGAIRDQKSTALYPSLWDVREDIVHASEAAYWLYHDLPEDEQQAYSKSLEGNYMPLAYVLADVCLSKYRLTLVFTRSFTSPTRFTAWKDVPTIYLQCEIDRIVPIAKQEDMISQAKQAGGLIETMKVTSGHSPFLVVPEKVVDAIQQLAS